jgi:histidinol dehydrogenase
MIFAAAEAGLDALWLIGGAQAIAALTFGAELEDGIIAPCDKLFGPGNAWVAEAKKQASNLPGGPAVDMPAGPSELLVIADRDADPEIAAADLLSQAEHDADAQVILVSESRANIDAILAEVDRQLQTLPRADIARASLAEGRAIRVRDLAEACEVANLYAPEHLALQTVEPDRLVERITAAGAVFVGAYAAETLGDYAAGPSHVLPTDGAARTMGGVTTASFMTTMSVQVVTGAGAAALAPVAARLARLEGGLPIGEQDLVRAGAHQRQAAGRDEQLEVERRGLVRIGLLGRRRADRRFRSGLPLVGSRGAARHLHSDLDLRHRRPRRLSGAA